MVWRTVKLNMPMVKRAMTINNGPLANTACKLSRHPSCCCGGGLMTSLVEKKVTVSSSEAITANNTITA